MDPFLFELSGEHPSMPMAEALSLLALEPQGRVVESGPGYLVCSMEDASLDRVADRIALTHRIGKHLLTCHPNELWHRAEALELPPGSFSVRVKRFESAMAEVDTRSLTRRMGGLFKNNKVELNNPDMELRVFLSDRVSIHIASRGIDRRSLETRKVAERPFSSPISLHPRFARALVNMTGVRPGEALLDPLCGTGGLLLEAASMGIKAIASDVSESMVDGCRSNLAHYGHELFDSAVCDVGDIEDHFGHLAAVVTDPPYGRSTSTGGEPLEKLYARTVDASHAVLKRGGALGIALPSPLAGWKGFQEVYRFSQRVHRSLTRNYHVLQRRG